VQEESARSSPLIDHIRSSSCIPDRYEHLSYILDQVDISGLYLEFGVLNGDSINHIADVIAPHLIYGFDSFTGLPEEWKRRKDNTLTFPIIAPMTNLERLAQPVFRDPRLSRMAAFLGSIGIEMRPGKIEVETLFPGSLISHGSLVIDEAKLIAPGDALHEAAHIALAPPERRADDFAFLEDADGGEEVTTIAWSWAALLELKIQPEDIFHGTAYKDGGSSTILDCGRRGIYIGFPLLQAWEMAFDPPNALSRGVKPFPHMVKWIRETTTQ
jgi:hypothetical protein